MDELTRAALNYIDYGLSVIALTGKQPNVTLHRHGLSEPLSPHSGVSEAMTHPRTTGVAIVIPYPYIVVDVDGEVGAQNWLALAGESDFMPDRWVARTGRGLHLWYATETPCGNGRLAEQLDLKGQGGYVAAPPSRHPDGHTYAWLAAPTADLPPMEAPPALQRWIDLRESDRARAILSKQMTPWVRHAPLEDGILYATYGWDGLVTGMAAAGAGNRNNYLHWAAAVMSEEHATDDDFQALYDAAVAAGLHRSEVIATIRSARRG